MRYGARRVDLRTVQCGITYNQPIRVKNMALAPHGLLIGKFYPPHRGHMQMIDYARQQVQQLYVLVGSLPEENIDGRLRARWLRELYFETNVTVVHNPNIRPSDLPQSWAEDIRGFLPFVPSVLFSAEDYGDELAAALGITHQRFPTMRNGTSGTRVRANPYGEWNALPPPVRAHYAKRVGVVGAESSGKTTLCARLSQHYTTLWMPEYGREFVDRKGALPDFGDHLSIAQVMYEREAALLRECNRFLLMDTEWIVQEILGRYYVNAVAPLVYQAQRERPIALYLFTDIDIPWAGDGLHREGLAVRQQLHDEIRTTLEARGLSYVLLRGDVETRIAAATRAIDALFA
jgi:HTH-type transcriptional regulator, transcriptional repressor of NAD biosynthesis genes